MGWARGRWGMALKEYSPLLPALDQLTSDARRLEVLCAGLDQVTHPPTHPCLTAVLLPPPLSPPPLLRLEELCAGLDVSRMTKGTECSRPEDRCVCLLKCTHPGFGADCQSCSQRGLSCTQGRVYQQGRIRVAPFPLPPS